MRTNVIVPIVIIIILFALGVIFIKGQSKDETSESITTTENSPLTASPQASSALQEGNNTQSTTTVSYTASGFTPLTVSVKQGDTVTFTNATTTPMWIASDPHPTHTNYSGFDSGKSVGQGESYTFTFTKAGSWSYHNHMRSSDKGTVTVQ
jgi:plastocyanin